MLKAEYVYNAMGMQVIRRVHQGGSVTEYHDIHDIDGNRVAEYVYDPVSQSSTVDFEYIWSGGQLIAVATAGANPQGADYFNFFSDQIGRPVFATDQFATRAWEATYYPFGGLATQNMPFGAILTLRFPGQWFQDETLNHQNRMRDYDPTTGRYLQPDPLGLIDGPAVYNYALNNPGKYIDPRGESLRSRVCNHGSAPLPLWSSANGYQILLPGDCMSWLCDHGDFVKFEGSWYKCGDTTICSVDNDGINIESRLYRGSESRPHQPHVPGSSTWDGWSPAADEPSHNNSAYGHQ